MMRDASRANTWLYAGIACAMALAGGYITSKLVTRGLEQVDPHFRYSFAPTRQLWPPFVHHIPHDGWLISLALFVTLGLVWWFSMLASRALARAGMPPAGILIVQGIVYLSLTACAFTISGDVYLFILWGRIYGVAGSNPYLFSAPATVTDPIVTKILAARAFPPNPDDYGPLWTIFEGLISKMETTASLAAQVWTHRVLTIACAVATSAGLARLLRKDAPQVLTQKLALFAFNPLVMYESAVEAHMDMLMIAPCVWAFAIAGELPLIAGLLLGAAVAIKFVPIILAPFLLLKIGRLHRPATAAIAAVFAAALVVLAYQPFGLGRTAIETLRQRAFVVAGSPFWLVQRALGHGTQPQSALAWIAVIAVLVVLAASVVIYARSARAEPIWRSIAAAIWATPGLDSEIFLWISPAMISPSRAWRSYSWAVCALALGYYALFISQEPPAFNIPVPQTIAFLLALIIVPIAIAFLTARRR